MSEQKAPADSCVLVTGGAGFIGSHTIVKNIKLKFSNEIT